jgi:uncharacterized protein
MAGKRKFEVLSNPFPVVGYNGPRYFCDREKELDQLRQGILHGRNITLIARRRIGKSSLLEHLSYTLRREKPVWHIITLDLIKTSSLEDLYKLLAQAIYDARTKGFLSKLTDLELLSRLRMTIGINPMTQLPEVSFDLKAHQTRQSLTALLSWLQKEKKVLIIFDEFQQILSYEDKNTEGYLRSEMMRLPRVRFIFSGSDQHLMEDMFHSSSRPFFNSTQNLGLSPISPSSYQRFILKHFKAAKRNISQDALDFIMHIANGETFAVQKLCNALYEKGYPEITLPLARHVLIDVLQGQQSYYERIRGLLRADSVQFQVLMAIARAGRVTEPTGKDFMSSITITNASSVRKAIIALEGYHLISKTIVEDKIGYFVNDAMFSAWLNTLPH